LFLEAPTLARSKFQHFSLILILGSLTALSPFSIDMYLPAFQKIASDFGVNIGRVGLSLSSYFFGLAFGQLLYGPLLDRFGRKPPLYVGLSVYIAASLACMLSPSADFLIGARVFQALGGCAAGVATMAMVRDLFSVKESSRVFALLVLVLSVSPLLAPTVGGYVAAYFGWKMVFVVLASIAALLLAAVALWLPVTHKADPTVELRPGPVLRNFKLVLSEPQFFTYAFAGATAFAGLFSYVTGSPILFLEMLKVSPTAYSWIFALLSIGLIGAAQVNAYLLKYFQNDQLFLAAITGQVITAVAFLVVALLTPLTLPIAFGFLFAYLSCMGFTSPNASALALAPFHRNTGSASAMLGFLQMLAGAVASTVIGALSEHGVMPLLIIFVVSASLSLTILVVGRRKIKGALQMGGPGEGVMAH
jgi:DHA1 family bicyclomycin/chloramphenicol resistance-like MFS transporter